MSIDLTQPYTYTGRGPIQLEKNEKVAYTVDCPSVVVSEWLTHAPSGQAVEVLSVIERTTTYSTIEVWSPIGRVAISEQAPQFVIDLTPARQWMN